MRTSTATCRLSVGHLIRFWDSFLGIPNRGSQSTCSFAAWTTMMCHLSIGTSAFRLCKATPDCLTLRTLRLLESPSRWTVAEPLDTSFMQPTTKTGKASKTRDSPWVTPGSKASPAAWPFTWSMVGARRRRGMGRRSSMASTSSTAM